MVALFARRIAVYPGDGLGEAVAASTVRLNLSNPEPWVMEHLRQSFGRGRRRGGERPLARARRGAARRQGHRRAARLAARIRDGRLERSTEEESVS